MKHVIMVMGYGDNADVLQETINILDDKDIDFLIHWDKKYDLPRLHAKKSKIIFSNRISVNWGTDSQIEAERILMLEALNCNNYDYAHLISSSDMPLMDVKHFKNYFNPNSYHIGYIDYLEDYAKNNIKYFYPIRHFKVRNVFWEKIILRIIRIINCMLKIDRIQNTEVEKGCNWFSMDIKYIRRIVNYKNLKQFMNTYTGDEFYVQTILKDLKPQGLTQKYNYYSDDYRMTHSSQMAARYIDWYRDRPYTFSLNDVNELKKVLNTNYAFARKINNVDIIKKVFDDE